MHRPEAVAPGNLRYAQTYQPDRNVSYETIHNVIHAYPRGELRRQLIACLRQGRARLQRSRGTDRRGQIPDMFIQRSRGTTY